MPEDEMDYEARAADRLTLFSDAVVAIAITLLAIDLPVPEGQTVAEFLTSSSPATPGFCGSSSRCW
jgi:uncharacterized membrane protein